MGCTRRAIGCHAGCKEYDEEGRMAASEHAYGDAFHEYHRAVKTKLMRSKKGRL